MAANGDNLAIQCNVIDNSVVFRKAIYLKIDEKSGNKFQITNKNNSIVTNSDGKLIWLGRILHWQVPPQQQYKFEVVTGSDGFGDYEIGKSGEQLHWKVTDQIGKEVTAN